MATKILKSAQDIAHDQLTVASVTQGLIDADSVSADDILGYEVTPFGANQFLISLIYLLYQKVGYSLRVILPAVLSRNLKITTPTKTSRILLRTTRTKRFKTYKSNTSLVKLLITKTFGAKYRQAGSALIKLATAVTYILTNIGGNVALLKLATVSLTKLMGFNQIPKSLLKTICTREAWYNTIPC